MGKKMVLAFMFFGMFCDPSISLGTGSNKAANAVVVPAPPAPHAPFDVQNNPKSAQPKSEVRDDLDKVPEEISEGDWFVAFIKAMQSLSGLKWQLQICLLLTLFISALKVSAWNVIWDKMGPYKALLAPILAMIGTLLMAWEKDQFSIGVLWVGFTTGAGSVALHEFFDVVKNIPGVNTPVLKVAEILSAVLGGKKS